MEEQKLNMGFEDFEENERVKPNLNNFAETEGLIIRPYISNEYQKDIIDIYIYELFNLDTIGNYKFIQAENAMLSRMLELCTNIKFSENETLLFTIDDVFNNIGSIKKMFYSMKNYDDFIQRLYATVEMVKEERRLEKSLGSVIDGLQGKVMSLLSAFEDLDPDKIKSLIDEIEKSTILKESLSLFKNQKSAKPE